MSAFKYEREQHHGSRGKLAMAYILYIVGAIAAVYWLNKNSYFGAIIALLPITGFPFLFGFSDRVIYLIGILAPLIVVAIGFWLPWSGFQYGPYVVLVGTCFWAVRYFPAIKSQSN